VKERERERVYYIRRRERGREKKARARKEEGREIYYGARMHNSDRRCKRGVKESACVQRTI
jgi:hypothetical protein